MFFREKKTSKKPILQLVESYRNEKGKVAQRIIVSLAGCWVPDELRKLVAVELTHRAQGCQRILEEDPDVESWVGKVLDRMEAEGRLCAPVDPGASAGRVRGPGFLYRVGNLVPAGPGEDPVQGPEAPGDLRRTPGGFSLRGGELLPSLSRLRSDDPRSRGQSSRWD